MALEPRNRQEDWYKEMIDAIGEGGGGSSEPILVTVSNNVASMTSTEIKAAISDGKIVYLRDGNLTMYEITTSPSGTPNAVVFTYNYLNSGSRVQINDDGSVVRGSLSAGTYSKPSGGIPESDLAQAVKDKLNKFVVTLAPTSLDYSGTMDKTVAEMTEAYNAGMQIVWRVILDSYTYVDVNVTAVMTNTNYDYPSFNAYVIEIGSGVLVYAHVPTTNDGTVQTYSTELYTLTPAT